MSSAEVKADKPRQIDTSIVINAPVEAVWKALTDAEELTRWFPLEARVKPGVGGSVWGSWRNEYQFESPIAAWEENRHLKLIYCEPIPPGTVGPDGKPMFPIPFQIACDYYLEAKGGKTVLRIVHSGFSSDPAWDAQYDGTVGGWAFEMRGLRHYLERHRGSRREVVAVRRFLTIPVEEAWGRLMGREGLFAEGRVEGAKEGDRYSMTTAAGDRLSGTVYINTPPAAFAAIVSEFGDAYLRVKIDRGCFPSFKPDANVWFSLYGEAARDAKKIGERYEALMTKLFGEVPAQQVASGE